MASQSVVIRLEVTHNSDGSFDASMSQDPAATLPPFVNIESNSLTLGVTRSATDSTPEEIEYSLEFSIITSGHQFDGQHPILWPYPPGTEFPALFSFGHAEVVENNPAQCTLPATVRPFVGGDSRGFVVFFNIVQTGPENNVLLSFVADPTIVTDPDPG